MPKRSYALESNGPRDLELEWQGAYKTMTVRLREQELATLDHAALSEGRDITLPDGTTLHLRLVSSFLSRELHLLRDGVPLPGTAGDPDSVRGEAIGALVFLAVANLTLGLVTSVTRWEPLVRAGLHSGSVATGVVYGVLALLAFKRQGWAYLVGAVLFGLDSLGSLSWVIWSNHNPNIGAILIRIMTVWYLVRGWRAAKGT